MSLPGAAIRPLPESVAAKIKSSTSITHLNGVILELVKNALDAGARTALVSVDFRRGSCIVEDDGNGIPPAEFEPTGGLGKPHHTSKLQQAGAFSHRGLFLACLASLSLLTVTSRHVNCQNTSSLIFHHSNPVARLIPAPAHQDLRLGEHGTCITVNDLFGNMPVRVKGRALSLEKVDELDKEWDHLRSSLVSLLLGNPQLSKLVISDIERSKRITIRTSTTPSGAYTDSSTTVVHLGRIGSIFAQSGLLSSRAMDSWHVVSAKMPDLTIQAAISTVPSPSKRIQFISLGKEPVLSRSNSNILFNEVNRLFSLSDFGTASDSHRGTPSTCSTPLPGDSLAPSSVGGRSRTKSVNKWPMFYIRIDTAFAQLLADGGDESSPDSEKPVQQIMDILGAMILEFLTQQGLRPRMMKRQTKIADRSRSACDASLVGVDSASRGDPVSSTEEALSSHFKLPSFNKPPSVNSGQQFYQWSRVKAANKSSAVMQPRVQNNASSDHSRLGDQLGSLPQSSNFIPRLRGSSQGPTNKALQNSRLLPRSGDVSKHSEPDKHIQWVDPHTGKIHLIDPRTGQTVSSRSSSSGSRHQVGNVGPLDRWTSLHRPQSTTAPPQGDWINGILRAWENPTFARTELPLPSLDFGSHMEPGGISHGCLPSIGSIDAIQAAKFEGKLQQQSLTNANIIAQVDQKFILAKLQSTSVQRWGDQEGVLVLIDQHAADERCRVERLFEEMFVQTATSAQVGPVHTTEIEPIVFNVSSTEASLFRKYMDFFKGWGIHYYGSSQSADEGTISIQALPTLIVERCRLEPNLVVDLLRREIWTNEEENTKARSVDRKRTLGGRVPDQQDDSISSRTGGPSHSWVQKMSGCPQGIFDLLNSRACRGAIMFNDPLSVDECTALVTRLGRCAFPFQCAHGRPSMVPILDLRSRLRDGPLFSDMDMSLDDHSERTLSFVDAFRARYIPSI
ncbi:hypothetical protein N7492_002942 [Penicillium capsulatum]|uniref:MutL C-terminal dimerisation domain-containing protein n=1 Tax=Penicillium capsulatum TaxID=69766 RepID=A0A9W9IKY4_9EURO|nr:hypothetical protein N7492_002942 [Penicillium capsulatum]KAJ6122465.1 hypothetical protein N7512_004930 [Penicillium capsulatum]